MKRQEALEIRCAQLCGKPIDPAHLAEAIEVIKATAHEKAPREKTARGRKPRQPTPEPPVTRTPSMMDWPGHLPMPPIPRKAAPQASPGAAAYRVPKPAMSYREAIAVRIRAANRQPVDALELMEANLVVQETRRRAMPAQESYQ